MVIAKLYELLLSSSSGSSYLASLLGLLTSVCIYLHIRAFSYWSSRGIKGPRPWPIFGTDIYYVLGNKLEVDKKWLREYGKTYGLYEGYSPLLRTTDNEVIKQIYVKRFSSFTDRHNEFNYHRVARNWLFWSEGERWSNQRALVTPMFTSSRLRNMLGTMTDRVDRFLGQVRAKLEQHNELEQKTTTTTTATTNHRNGYEQTTPVSLAATFRKRDLANMALDVIASSLFGLKLDIYNDEGLGGCSGNAENELLLAASKFSRFEPLRHFIWLLTPRHLARALTFDLIPYERYKYFDLLTKRVIEERRGRLSSGAGGKGESESKGEIKLNDGGDGGGAINKLQQVARSKDFIQLFMEAKLPENEKVNEKVFGVDDDKEAHYNDDCKHEQLEQIQREQTRKARLFKNFTDLEIRGQMTFLFLGGFETTSGTIVTCIYELAHKPNIQARLFKELEDTFGQERIRTDLQVCAPDGLPSAADSSRLREDKTPQPGDDLYSQLMSLRLLDAFVSEVLRLYSPIVDHTRRATEAVELTIRRDDNVAAEGGQEFIVKLPRGMPISTNGFVMQRDPDYFDQPEEFQLERFLPENRGKIKTCTFMPFGLGPRGCAGMRFALLEIKLALAKILASYEIAPSSSSGALAYPPKFKQNLLFMQLENSDFKLVPRWQKKRLDK